MACGKGKRRGKRSWKLRKKEKNLTWEQSSMTSSTTEVLDFIHTRPADVNETNRIRLEINTIIQCKQSKQNSRVRSVVVYVADKAFNLDFWDIWDCGVWTEPYCFWHWGGFSQNERQFVSLNTVLSFGQTAQIIYVNGVDAHHTTHTHRGEHRHSQLLPSSPFCRQWAADADNSLMKQGQVWKAHLQKHWLQLVSYSAPPARCVALGENH